MYKTDSKPSLISEFLLVFIALPALLAWQKPHAFVYIILWVLAIGCWLILRRNHGYRLRADWNFKAMNKQVLRPIILRFIPLAIFLVAFTLYTIPDRFASLPTQRPMVWMMVMILYPIISVVPQEFIFRSYFMTRFTRLLPSINARILVSGAVFGWAHIVLHNWEAVIFSGIGGILFADSYRKTKSLAVCIFEHALYGCFIFTIGMGYYFYHGTVR